MGHAHAGTNMEAMIQIITQKISRDSRTPDIASVGCWYPVKESPSWFPIEVEAPLRPVPQRIRRWILRYILPVNTSKFPNAHACTVLSLLVRCHKPVLVKFTNMRLGWAAIGWHTMMYRNHPWNSHAALLQYELGFWELGTTHVIVSEPANVLCGCLRWTWKQKTRASKLIALVRKQ